MATAGITALVFLLGYLVGGVPFGYLVARWRGVDIFHEGSGNVGATNVGRILGRRFGILVFCLDFAKGALPVLVAQGVAAAFGEPPQALGVVAGLAAFLGHLFPVYLQFRGGKGVATGAGAVTVLAPLPTLAALLTWLIAIFTTRYVSVASLTAAAALCLFRLALTPAPFSGENLGITGFCLLAAALVYVRHRANLGRLARGEENRLRDSGTMQIVTRTIHVLALGLWFGSAVFFSFIVAPVLFSNLDTRTAGVAISPMFDWYFLVQGVCGLLAAGTALGWPRREPKGRVHRLRAILLLAALLMVVVGWPLEQKVSALRIARYESGDALIQAEFVHWHLVSLILNLVTVLLVTVAMALTASLPTAGVISQAKAESPNL